MKVLPSLGLTGPSWDVTLIVCFSLGPRVAPLGWGSRGARCSFSFTTFEIDSEPSREKDDVPLAS